MRKSSFISCPLNKLDGTKSCLELIRVQINKSSIMSVKLWLQNFSTSPYLWFSLHHLILKNKRTNKLEMEIPIIVEGNENPWKSCECVIRNSKPTAIRYFESRCRSYSGLITSADENSLSATRNYVKFRFLRVLQPAEKSIHQRTCLGIFFVML